MRFSNSNVLPTSFDCNGYVIGRRTESDRVADGNRSGGGRKPIGWRTQSDWVAGAFKGVHLSQVHQQSCQCTNKAILILLLFCWCSSCLFCWCSSCLLGWCSSCLVGALETSAPPKEDAEE